MSSESGSKRTCSGNLDAQLQPQVHGFLFCFVLPKILGSNVVRNVQQHILGIVCGHGGMRPGCRACWIMTGSHPFSFITAPMGPCQAPASVASLWDSLGFVWTTKDTALITPDPDPVATVSPGDCWILSAGHSGHHPGPLWGQSLS